jgi:DNA-binding transcriptional ArsR family regulator
MGTSAQRGARGFQEAVSYAVGHRIRVEILVALHDLETASATELARIVHEPLSTVTHHVSELLKAGSIRIARTEKVRSVNQHFYSVVNPLYLSDEDQASMSVEEQEEVCRVILQSLIAEALASFWAGNLVDDPRLFLYWSWYNVDEEGRAAIADEQERAWKRFQAIEREAAARCAASGVEPFSVLVSQMSFRRARTAARPKNSVDNW